jgi:O-antigen/teichoic acid export membrane protein
MKLLISMALLVLGQVLVWLQLNSQFFNDWAKRHPVLLSVAGGSIVAYIFLLSTKYAVEHFDGLLWPGRMLSFASGMIIMSIFTWYFMGEGINAKTAVSILLSFIILCIQIFWK